MHAENEICLHRTPDDLAAFPPKRNCVQSGWSIFTEHLMARKGSNNYIIQHHVDTGMRLYADGSIRLASGKKLFIIRTHNGYASCQLRCPATNKRVFFTRARLTCWLFHGPPPTSTHEVDHINRNRLDDRPENLRWASPSEQRHNVDEAVKEKQRKLCRKTGLIYGGGRAWAVHKARTAIAIAERKEG